MLVFSPIPRLFPNQPLWGALGGRYSFVISQDRADGFTASAKEHPSVPFVGKRIDLGGYCGHESFESAKAACEDWLEKNRS